MLLRHNLALAVSFFFFFFFFFHLTYSRWTSSLPSCLWSQRIFPSLPGSCLTIFLSRCKFSTLTSRQPMIEFYLLTFPRFPLRKNTNPTLVRIELTTSVLAACAAYLLDHSGDELNRSYASNGTGTQTQDTDTRHKIQTLKTQTQDTHKNDGSSHLFLVLIFLSLIMYRIKRVGAIGIRRRGRGW